MKSISAFNSAAIDALPVSPIRLLKIEFDGGLTLRLCSRVWGDPGAECTFDGELYEPLVLSWDTIRAGSVNPVTYEVDPDETAFTIDNNTPVGGAERFTALFTSYNPHYALVTQYEIFEGATDSADLIPVFVGRIEDFLELTADRVTATCTGYSLDIANRFNHSIINTTDYPGADPDDLGKMAPQVYGSASRVPAIAVDAGGKSTIVSDMTASSPGNSGTLGITDGSAMPTGAFIIQIDSEQISIASRSGNVLTLAASGARGYNSTEATDHDKGSGVAEIQTEYIYKVADHPVKSLNTIYVDNVRQTSGFTAYTGQGGDEKTGYEGKAVIVFNTLPTYAKQVNVVANDTIGVNDGIGVSDTISVSQGSHAHDVAEEVIVWPFDSADVAGGGPTYSQYLIDNNMVTQTGFRFAGDKVNISTAQYKSFSGAPTYYRIALKMVADGGGNIRFTFDGRVINITAVGTVQSSWYAVKTTSDTWTEVNNLVGVVECTSAGASTNAIVQAWVEFKYTGAAEASPATGVAKSGAASKSGSVTKVGTVTISGNSTAETVIGESIAVDVDGYLDDGTGTYTGTPNALIERPDHIIKHILIDRCGLTSSQIDSVSHAAAGTFYNTNSFVLGFAILQRPNVRALLNRVATQAKSIEFWEAGTHHLKHIPASESVVDVIDANRIDLNQIYLKYTERIDIKNRLTARYNRHWSGYDEDIEADRAIVAASDSGSITTYGTLEGDPLSFPYIPGATQAQAVLDWRLNDLKQPRLMVELSGGYYLTKFERGDVVSLDVTSFQDETYFEFYSTSVWDWQNTDNFIFHVNQEYEENLLLGAVVGLIQSTDKFRVIDVLRRPDATIQIQLIQILE